MKKILLIRLRAMGDVLLSTPAAHALRERFPEAELTMLVDDVWAPLLAGNPDIQEVLALPRARASAGASSRASANLADLSLARSLRRRAFDLVVDLFGNPRSAFFTWSSGARLRVGYRVRGRAPAYNIRQPRHVLTDGQPLRRYAALVNLDMLETLGARTNRWLPRLDLAPSEKKEAREFLASLGVREDEQVVGVLAAGSWPAKTWPAERFAALGDLLASRPGTRVLLLWGPGERDLALRVAGIMRQQALLAPAMGIRAAAALLAELSLFVGNDSGPKHLAAAVGTATVALYGPTDPRTWSPPGEEHVAVCTEVPCGPCDRTHCDDLRCLLSITPERVARSAVMLLEGRRRRAAGPRLGPRLESESD